MELVKLRSQQDLPAEPKVANKYVHFKILAIWICRLGKYFTSLNVDAINVVMLRRQHQYFSRLILDKRVFVSCDRFGPKLIVHHENALPGNASKSSILDLQGPLPSSSSSRWRLSKNASRVGAQARVRAGSALVGLTHQLMSAPDFLLVQVILIIWTTVLLKVN